MTDYKKLAEDLELQIYRAQARSEDVNSSIYDVRNLIAAALERQAKEGEIRGLEACKELCGVDMDLPIGSFVQEFEIDAEIARRRGETNG